MSYLYSVMLYSVIKIMLEGYVHTATFILAVVGLVGCAGRFDYNLLLALGWIYLSDKNPHFSKSFAFYVLVLGSVIIDSITIFASSDQVDRYTFLFMPLFEIFIKLAIFALSLYYQRKRSGAENQEVQLK